MQLTLDTHKLFSFNRKLTLLRCYFRYHSIVREQSYPRKSLFPVSFSAFLRHLSPTLKRNQQGKEILPEYCGIFMNLQINQKAYYDLCEVVTCPLLFDHACHLVLKSARVSAAQTPSTGLRHPSLEEGAGKLCSE